MKNNIFNKLSSGNLINPVSGEKISIKTDPILIESGCVSKISDFLKSKNAGKVAVVSDDNTHAAAGAKIESELCKQGFEVASIVIESDTIANEDNLNLITAVGNASDIFIAVGGGTINDLAKLSSYNHGKEYIAVPTCPSVNGFSSSNASIEIDGIKKSVAAHLPLAIFMDLDIVANAPFRLIMSGFGDCLARGTAQADWLLSHYILGTEYNPLPFEILKDDEEYLFNNYEKLQDADVDTIEALSRLLILSGFGMYIAKSSSPASQAEHLISHYIEMFYHDDIPHTYHGEQIAVTSILMAGIQEDILALENIKIDPLSYSEKPMFLKFGEKMASNLLKGLAKKEIDEEAAAEINQNLVKNWDKVSSEIKEIIIPSEKLTEMLKNLSGPYTYKHLGWANEQIQEAIKYAPYIRGRFTFLDFAMCISKESQYVEDRVG